MVYLNAKEAQRHYGVCARTLYRWAQKGNIPYKRGPYPNSPRKYWTSLVESAENQEEDGGRRRHTDTDDDQTKREQHKHEKAKIIYCRVSSHKQKDDLQRQIQSLTDQWPQYEVVSDIASGLNVTSSSVPNLYG